MSVIEDHPGLRDTWAETHSNTPAAFTQNMQPVDAVHTFEITADSPVNTYAAGKPLDGYAIQFVLYRSIRCSRSERQFWNQRRAMWCLWGASPGKLIRFLIISGLRRLSLSDWRRGNRETLIRVLILKYPVQVPIRLRKPDRRVQSSTHRSRLPQYLVCSLIPLRD